MSDKELPTIVNPDEIFHAWTKYKEKKEYPRNYNVKITLHDLFKVIEFIMNPQSENLPALKDSDFPPVGKYAKTGDEPTTMGQLSRSYMRWIVSQAWVREKYPSFWKACDAKLNG